MSSEDRSFFYEVEEGAHPKVVFTGNWNRKHVDTMYRNALKQLKIYQLELRREHERSSKSKSKSKSKS